MTEKTTADIERKHIAYKIDLLRDFLLHQTEAFRADSASDWVQGCHDAYKASLELLNTFFKEE